MTTHDSMFTFDHKLPSANLSRPSNSSKNQIPLVTNRINPPTNPCCTKTPSVIPPMIPSVLYAAIKPFTKSMTVNRTVTGKNILPVLVLLLPRVEPTNFAIGAKCCDTTKLYHHKLVNPFHVLN